MRRVYEEQPVFRDRADAGSRLAGALERYGGTGAVVMAVPRGGVPIGIEVGDGLGAGFDIIVARKIQIPYNPEAGYGAVTEDGTVVLNTPLVEQLSLARWQIERQAEGVRAEIARRAAVFRRELSPAIVEGKTCILVDDGLASGFTMLAAVQSARQRHAGRVVVAVPVASDRAFQLVEPVADETVALVVSASCPFAVASFYDRWYDLTDEEVLEYLKGWRRRHGS